MGKTESRKLQHLNISLKKNVQFKVKTTGLENVSFNKVELNYSALPEMDKGDVNLETLFLGKKFDAPLMVEAITGGVDEAAEINKDIAKACEDVGIGMGLGSQRAMIEKPELAYTYQVRDVAPSIFLAGNIGVTELGKIPAEEIKAALSVVEADALAVHINAAQAAMQPEKETDFRGRLKEISKITK